MSKRLARALSVGAVLATTSAVAFTSQIGGGGASASQTSSTDGTSGTGSSGSTTGGTTGDTVGSSAASSAPGSAPVSVAGSAVDGSTTQLSFLAGDAATVILDSANGSLRIVTFAPHPGWFTVRLEQPSPTQLVVDLESAGGTVRFLADLVGGAIDARLETIAETDTLPGSTGPGDSGPGTSGPGTSGPDTSGASTSGPSTSDNGSSSTSSTDPNDDGGNSGPGGGGGGSGSG